MDARERKERRETREQEHTTLGFPVLIGALLLISALFAGMKLQKWYFSDWCILSSKTCALKTAMRDLWLEHMVWTREFVKEAIDGNDNVQDIVDRLMRNQEDIGNAVASYYGNDAGKQLTALLKEHISIAAEVVKAAKADDKDALTDADKRWHDNAKDIADFLSSANPNWPQKDLLDMLNEHLRLTTEEATARLKKDWNADIKLSGEVIDQIRHMADALTEGITKQFPDKF